MRQLINHRYKIVIRNGIRSRLRLLLIGWVLLSVFISVGFSDELSPVVGVEFQPFAAATQRLVEALDYLGSPLSESDLTAIEAALISENPEQAIADIQRILDCLLYTSPSPRDS